MDLAILHIKSTCTGSDEELSTSFRHCFIFSTIKISLNNIGFFIDLSNIIQDCVKQAWKTYLGNSQLMTSKKASPNERNSKGNIMRALEIL